MGLGKQRNRNPSLQRNISDNIRYNGEYTTKSMSGIRTDFLLMHDPETQKSGSTLISYITAITTMSIIVMRMKSNDYIKFFSFH